MRSKVPNINQSYDICIKEDDKIKKNSTMEDDRY